MCTTLEVVLVLVWLIIESSPLAPILVPGFMTILHPLEVLSPLDTLDSFPWLQSSSIVPRHLLRWLSIVVLEELLSEVVILRCTIPSGDIHELDELTSQ
jgi:hypothetical protein